ncbi:MAG: hypothetical protein AUH85_06405 [Chloroflexi bacterium 13_1_40CM_4_68_4]|nr:MAG: hypothetical protein AUH85_06405 [Chloroflexi bacterium 13_1_40CM_4_68_4]
MPTTLHVTQPETTERRLERRFLLTEEVARMAMRTVSSHLSLASDDRPYQWSTTVYCDTYDWRAYQDAERGDSLQLRFREYHRIRPDRVLATARTWIELKEDTPKGSVKERFGLPAKHVPALLRGDDIPQLDGDALFTRGKKFIARGARPVVATQYNRIAYSGPQDRVRITADHNLMYLAVPWASNADSAVPARLGPVLAQEPDVIFEIKWFEEMPDWATRLLEWIEESAHDRRQSKFVVAMRHLLGVGNKAAS